MKCTQCDYPESHVVYTLQDDMKNHIVRRRECLRCGARFTTNEKIHDKNKTEQHGHVK